MGSARLRLHSFSKALVLCLHFMMAAISHSLENGEERVTNPYFTSTSRTYQTKLGAGVTFHCQVENIGTSTLIWKKDNRIISAGQVIIRKDKRFSLDGYNLTMQGVQVKDEGEYICEVETYTEPIQQKNQLSVLIPAQVEPNPQSGVYLVKAGSSIMLECKASGNPKPTITWKKQNALLPSGKKNEFGSSIFIQSVRRENAGMFVCMADNGVGNQATANMNLTVMHAPVIKMGKFVESVHNRVRVELTCEVHAEPIPHVTWYKDNMLLDPSSRRQMQTTGKRHNLILRNLAITDFGNYSCIAENNIGKNRSTIPLSGSPQKVTVTSPYKSFESKQYDLTWESISLLRITEYRILYKRDEEHQVPTEGWTNIIPQMNKKNSRLRYDGVVFKGSFTLYGLIPGTNYQVVVEARNEEGWSKSEKPFKFSTPEEENRGLSFFSGHTNNSRKHIVMKSIILMIMLMNCVFG